MIEWVTVRNAIHAWISDATGIPAARVIPADQNGPRPATPFAEFTTEVERVGQDWVDVDDAAAPVSGGEIDHKSRGTRRMVVRVRVFGGDATGSASSRALVSALIGTHILPTRQAALRAAGVGVAEFSRVTNVGGVINSTKIEPRAMLDITCFLSSEVTEAGTYIANVQVTDQISDPDNVFLVELGLSGPRVTEDGFARVTEDGQTRVVE